jgi:hypothetical protein
MPRKMSDAQYRDYRKFQQAAGEMRKEGKTEAQIDVAAKLPDERMAARKLRREAGGESLLKPYGMGRQPNPRGGGK